MTDAEIDRLSGLELRKAVAESLGWRDFYIAEYIGLCAMRVAAGYGWCGYCVPHFERSLSAAWPLAEKMNADKRFGGVNLSCFPNPACIAASLDHWKFGQTEASSQGTSEASAATAICRLWLEYCNTKGECKW